MHALACTRAHWFQLLILPGVSRQPPRSARILAPFFKPIQRTTSLTQPLPQGCICITLLLPQHHHQCPPHIFPCTTGELGSVLQHAWSLHSICSLHTQTSDYLQAPNPEPSPQTSNPKPQTPNSDLTIHSSSRSPSTWRLVQKARLQCGAGGVRACDECCPQYLSITSMQCERGLCCVVVAATRGCRCVKS